MTNEQRDLLFCVRNLLEDGTHWCQEMLSSEGSKFCLYGALIYLSLDYTLHLLTAHQVEDIMVKHLERKGLITGIITFNDNAKNHKEVIELIDEVLALENMKENAGEQKRTEVP